MSIFGALVKTVLLPVTLPVAVVVDAVEVVADKNRGRSHTLNVAEDILREVDGSK